MTSGTLGDYLEIWGFEDNFVIFADGSIGFGLKAQPVDITYWDDERTNVRISVKPSTYSGLRPSTCFGDGPSTPYSYRRHVPA